MLGGSLRAAWVLLRVAILVGAIAIAVAWKQFGYVPVAVQTGSMTPTYPVHTLLFVHDVPDSQVRRGDVITFDPPGAVPRTTHRVVEREQYSGKWYFVTKGDANPAPDDWRASNDDKPSGDAIHDRGVSYPTGFVPRTEFGIPHLGWLAMLGKFPHVRMALLALPFVVIAIQLLAWIWRRDDKDEDEDEDASDSVEMSRDASVAA